MMKQNAGKRIDNILIKLPESMRDRIEKLPAQTLQQLEEIRIRTNTDTLLISGGREYSLRDGDEITGGGAGRDLEPAAGLFVLCL